MFRDLKINVLSQRNKFQQLSANLRYYHALLAEELQRQHCAGVNTAVQGKDRTQMLTEVGQHEQQLIQWDNENSCRQMLNKVNNRLDYSAPTLFIVLPWQPDTWNHLDRSTHTFRLYFLCHNKKSRDIPSGVPQHIHLASHPGYDLIHPQEFFLRYGHHALQVLRMVKFGYSDEFNEVPVLDTLKILSSGEIGPPDEIPQSQAALEPLIDQAIAYLAELPKSNTGPEMTRNDGTEIRKFLHVPGGQNAAGNLYYYIDRVLRVSWMCMDHACVYLDYECLQKLQDFVNTHGGCIDVQQAILKVNLESTAEVEQFLALLINTKHSFNISIKLNWTVSRKCLEGLCQAIDESNVVRLEIEGITADTHSQDPVQNTADMFAGIISSAKLKFITLVNYPRLQEQCYYAGDCSFLSVVSPAQPDLDWVGLRDALRSFSDSVTAKTVKAYECMEASKKLQSALVGLGFSDVTAVRVHHKSWDGTLEFQKGAFVDLHSPRLQHPISMLNFGSLRRLTLDLVDLESEQEVYRMVQNNRGLQELNISVQGKDVLYSVEHIARLWSISKSSLGLTLFEHAADTRGRFIAQVVLEGRGGCRPGTGTLDDLGCNSSHSGSQPQALPRGVDFLQWNCDYSFSPTSDYSASLLNVATRQYHLSLTSFTLDVSSLTYDGLGCIRNFLHLSNLEHLRIKCTSFNSRLSSLIAQILGAVPWSTLKSLALNGSVVDEWIQLWTPVTFSQLLQLDIQPSGSEALELSHVSVLFIHQLTCLSPLIEVHFGNVEFQDKRDWELIVDGLDPSFLETIGRDNGCNAQLSVADERDLFRSKFERA